LGQREYYYTSQKKENTIIKKLGHDRGVRETSH
jgi:hypothetical protein